MHLLRMTPCRACGGRSTRQLLDAGPQPISSRYLDSASATEDLHPMVLGQCTSCGLVQLAETVPAAELIPLHPWIAYHESDEHLPQFVEQILKLPGLSTDS